MSSISRPTAGRGDGAGRGRRQERRRCDADRARRRRCCAPSRRRWPSTALDHGQGEAAGHRTVGRSRDHRKEQTLDGGWFAAPEPNADDAFNDKYRATYGATPPQLASLAYDAVSLVALLSHGHALSPLHQRGADGPQWLCRRQRHLPLQCRRHVGARAWRSWKCSPTAFTSSARRRRPSSRAKAL